MLGDCRHNDIIRRQGPCRRTFLLKSLIRNALYLYISTARDEVECCDILFFARNDVCHCDPLQYRSTENKIHLFYVIKKLKYVNSECTLVIVQIGLFAYC